MCGQREKEMVTTYPTTKPARCNENTASITIPSSSDNIVFMAIHGDASKLNDELTSDDLKRTIFSEKTLMKNKTRIINEKKCTNNFKK